jgi:hypothetical protein
MELEAIREVVTIYPKRRNQKKPSPQQTVLTKTSNLQQRLIQILDLKQPEKTVLG